MWTEKKNWVTSHIFTRYDDHVVMPRHMTNEIHKPEFRECSCNWLGTICEITFQKRLRLRISHQTVSQHWRRKFFFYIWRTFTKAIHKNYSIFSLKKCVTICSGNTLYIIAVAKTFFEKSFCYHLFHF